MYIYNFQNIKYGDTTNTEDVRLRTGKRETNLSSDDDMLDINHPMSHHSDNNMLSDCVRIDDTSSHSKLFTSLFLFILLMHKHILHIRYWMGIM